METGIVNLEGAAVAAIQRLVQSGDIEKAIDKAVGETVTSAVHDALRSYSDFGKQVQKAVSKALAIHGAIDLPTYNDALLKIVAKQVETLTRNTIEKEVAGRMKELLKPAPERIKLSKLIEEYVDSLRDKSRHVCSCHGDERAFAELRESSVSGFRDIVLAESREKPTYGSNRKGQIVLGVHLNQKDEPNVGEIFRLHFNSGDVEKQMFAGPFYGFERSLFQMRAAKTLIDIDCDPADCDLYYGNSRD